MSPFDNLRIVEVEDADFPHLFEILSESFDQRHPFIESFYPNHKTPKGRKAGAVRLLAFAKADPDAHFVKCIDDKNTILGFAKWNIWVDVSPTLPPNSLPWSDGNWDTTPWQGSNTDDSELARWTLERYIHLRLTAREASKGRLASLDLMCVHPDYQRIGVGSLLVGWGCEQADKHGSEAVVEASDEGKGLYQKWRFRSLRHVVLNEPNGKWEGRERQEYWWMVRPMKGKDEVSRELREAAKDTKFGTVVDSGRMRLETEVSSQGS